MPQNHERLTHHETLRLDYLTKNIHYLNEREREELHYLQAKQGLSGSRVSRAAAHPKQHTPSPPSFSQREGASTYTPEGLPRMPRQRGQSRKDRRLSSNDSTTKSRKVRDRTPSQAPIAQPKKVKKTPKPTPARPRKKGWFKRLVKGLFLLVCLMLIGMIVMYFKGYHSIKSDPQTQKVGEKQYFDGQPTTNGTNILVLGTDVRPGQAQEEARTDSIMVVNIGNSDGKIKIVSFMRDTLINLPGYSQEDGYNVYYDHKLNSAFNLGQQANGQGAEAMRKVLKAHFNIDIQYYAMVDFASFAIAVDTLFPNGVTIDAQFGTVEGQDVTSVEVPNDTAIAENAPAYQTIHEGVQQMDGKTLLNYARFRSDDEVDAGRVRRQQEVLIAMLQQVKDPVKLFTGSEALGKIMALTSTNVPYSFMLTNGLGVINSASNIEQLTVPALGDWLDEYDLYGGQGLLIDFDKYKEQLAALGF